MPPTGNIELCLVEGNTRNGSDFCEKLKYLPKGEEMRKLVSPFILIR